MLLYDCLLFLFPLTLLFSHFHVFFFLLKLQASTRRYLTAIASRAGTSFGMSNPLNIFTGVKDLKFFEVFL